MNMRGTVGSLIESHRAKSKRPDRRIFLPQTRQLPSAAPFSRRLPQLRSIVPKASLSVPNGPPPVPIFLASLPRECPRSHWRQGRAQRSGGRPPFFCRFSPFTGGFFPISPRVFPNFPDTFPNFSPAALIYNGLFPSHLHGIAAKSRKKRKDKPSPVLADTLSHRMGATVFNL